MSEDDYGAGCLLSCVFSILCMCLTFGLSMLFSLSFQQVFGSTVISGVLGLIVGWIFSCKLFK